MSSAEYQVLVLDTSGNEVDLIDSKRLESLQYKRVVNGIGNATLTFSSDTDRAFEWYQNADYLLEIYRNDLVEGTYLLRVHDVAERDDREQLIISGRSLEDFLRRRIVVPEDDPAGAGGFSTKAGNADTVMIGYVTDQCINPAVDANRVISGLSAANIVNVGNLTFQRLKQENNLLEALQDIAYQTSMDFVIVRTSGAAFEFRPQFTGVNRTKTVNYPHSPFLMFDVRRGNMRNPRLVVNRADEINYLYMAGQGTEDSRIYLPVFNSDAMSVSPWNRCEGTADARNDESVDELISSGAGELRENRAQTDLSFSPDLASASVVYKVDWDLGDWVTAAYRGFEEDLRITEITVRATRSGESIQPRIENVRTSQ